MASHTFGALTLDLPGEWEDQTILTFVKRPKARMATAAVQDMNRNLIISRAWADGTFDVHDLAATHLEGLKAAIPDLEVLKEDTAEIAGAPALLREVRFATPSSGIAQQLHVFVVRGELALTCVGTGSAGMAFQWLRKEMLGILESLQVQA